MAWKIESKSQTEVYVTVKGKVAIKQDGAYGLSEDQVVILDLEDVDRVAGWMREAKEQILANPGSFESDDQEEADDGDGDSPQPAH